MNPVLNLKFDTLHIIIIDTFLHHNSWKFLTVCLLRLFFRNIIKNDMNMLRNSQNQVQLLVCSFVHFTRRLASTKKTVSKPGNVKLKKFGSSELPVEDSINPNYLARMLGQ